MGEAQGGGREGQSNFQKKNCITNNPHAVSCNLHLWAGQVSVLYRMVGRVQESRVGSI